MRLYWFSKYIGDTCHTQECVNNLFMMYLRWSFWTRKMGRGAAGPLYSPLEELGGGGGDRKSHSWRWLLWLPVLMAGSVLYLLNIHSEINLHGPRRGRLAPLSEPAKTVESLFLVDSEGCRIPALDPFDKLVMPYIKKPQPIDCLHTAGRPLVESNLTALIVVPTVRDILNETSDFTCCYTPFIRHPSHDNKIQFVGNCTYFENEVVVEDEFVRVVCHMNNTVFYEDYHAFVPRKPEVEKRCNDAPTQSNSFDSTAPSVLIVGIDAVSRLNFHRQMPLTLDLLKELGAVEMLGYNKVGDNTFPNMVPALVGESVDELRKSCWPEDNSPFDNCSFVWDAYKEAGYRTSFVENAPWMGIFNYVKKGFESQPTDYYGRPWILTMEQRIGHTQQMNAKLCVGGRLVEQALLDYGSKFVQSFKSERFFSLLWGCSMSHDFLNYPSLADKMYMNFLSELIQTKSLDRTVLMLMSDHGIRWGGIRKTYQGRLEERLPFLYLVFPPWFREQHPEAIANVEHNARRLTTHYDLYETLTDLLRPAQRLTKDAIRESTHLLMSITASPEGPPRGISLFLPVPRNRTCPEAGIDAHWCTCQESRPVDMEDPIVNRTALFLLNHINGILASFHQCAKLTIAEIKDVQLEVPRQDLKEDTGNTAVHDYVIILQTVPGDAIFEGTVRHKPSTDELAMGGSVSRLNLYGSQSACVSNYIVKLYCYCTS